MVNNRHKLPDIAFAKKIQSMLLLPRQGRRRTLLVFLFGLNGIQDICISIEGIVASAASRREKAPAESSVSIFYPTSSPCKDLYIDRGN